MTILSERFISLGRDPLKISIIAILLPVGHAALHCVSQFALSASMNEIAVPVVYQPYGFTMNYLLQVTANESEAVYSRTFMYKTHQRNSMLAAL